MITLNLLQLLENNGFGTIDENLFWEKLTLGEEGVFKPLNSTHEPTLTWQAVASCETSWIS